MVSGGPGDRQGVLHHHIAALRPRDCQHLPHGTLQPGPSPALPRRPQKIFARIKKDQTSNDWLIPERVSKTAGMYLPRLLPHQGNHRGVVSTWWYSKLD